MGYGANDCCCGPRDFCVQVTECGLNPAGIPVVFKVNGTTQATVNTDGTGTACASFAALSTDTVTATVAASGGFGTATITWSGLGSDWTAGNPGGLTVGTATGYVCHWCCGSAGFVPTTLFLTDPLGTVTLNWDPLIGWYRGCVLRNYNDLTCTPRMSCIYYTLDCPLGIPKLSVLMEDSCVGGLNPEIPGQNCGTDCFGYSQHGNCLTFGVTTSAAPTQCPDPFAWTGVLTGGSVSFVCTHAGFVQHLYGTDPVTVVITS